MSTAEIRFEPLTALAGGILGGAAVATLAWRLAWRAARPRSTRHPRGARA